MIVDADTHIAPSGGEFGLERHIEEMERAGIEKTVTWLQPGYEGTEIEKYNAYVYEAVRRYPDRILGFGWADPTVGVEHAKTMVKICTGEYGFYGVKLNGAQNDFYIDDPSLSLPVIEEIARSGKLLAFHIGPDAYEKTHPLRAARVAELFPDLPILMVHMGMYDRTMNGVVIEVAGRCSNMLLVGSQTTETAILKAVGILGARRVCFGSDDPFRNMHVALATYKAMLGRAVLNGEITEAQEDLIMGGNIVKLFSLEDGGSGRMESR
jgi:predicted TIM-barrel fold metal-dependent hydrolase